MVARSADTCWSTVSSFRRSRSRADAAESSSEIWQSRRRSSPSAQYVRPSPVDGQRPCSMIVSGWRADARLRNSRTRRLLPIPAGPEISAIHRVAGHDVLVGGGHHLARVDADANRQADTMLRRELGIQLR